jgi:hypothetical protein
LAPAVVRGTDEPFVAPGQFRKIAQEQLTDSSPTLQRVREHAIDNQMIGASAKGGDSDANGPLSGCGSSWRLRGHQCRELCQQIGPIVGGTAACHRQERSQRLTQTHVLVPSPAVCLVCSDGIASDAQAFSMPPGILQR